MTVSSLILLLFLLLRVPEGTYSAPHQQPFLEEDLAGSGEAEGSSTTSPSFSHPQTPALSPTPVGPQPTPPVGPQPPTTLLEGLKDFFRQYILLIAVVGSLVFLLMFIVCAALITRQKHKATAYYPSSFPKKKYVDQSDRAGGPRAFSEVPDRAPAGRPEEALDSSQQLQADILAATQSLRSPARAVPSNGDTAAQGDGQAEEREPAQPCPAEQPEAGTPTDGGGQEEPEAEVTSLLVQEADGPVGPPESACACSTVSPDA